MKVAVIVIDVAGVRSIVAVFVQNSKCYTAIDAQSVDRHKAFVTSLLLYDTEDAIAEVLGADTYHVGIPLTEVTTKYEHVAHLLQCFNFVATHFHHLLHAEAVSVFIDDLKMIDVTDLVGSKRYLVRNIIRDVNLAVTRVKFYAILRRPIEHGY